MLRVYEFFTFKHGIYSAFEDLLAIMKLFEAAAGANFQLSQITQKFFQLGSKASPYSVLVIFAIQWLVME